MRRVGIRILDARLGIDPNGPYPRILREQPFFAFFKLTPFLLTAVAVLFVVGGNILTKDQFQICSLVSVAISAYWLFGPRPTKKKDEKEDVTFVTKIGKAIIGFGIPLVFVLFFGFVGIEATFFNLHLVRILVVAIGAALLIILACWFVYAYILWYINAFLVYHSELVIVKHSKTFDQSIDTIKTESAKVMKRRQKFWEKWPFINSGTFDAETLGGVEEKMVRMWPYKSGFQAIQQAARNLEVEAEKQRMEPILFQQQQLAATKELLEATRETNNLMQQLLKAFK